MASKVSSGHTSTHSFCKWSQIYVVSAKILVLPQTFIQTIDQVLKYNQIMMLPFNSIWMYDAKISSGDTFTRLFGKWCKKYAVSHYKV